MGNNLRITTQKVTDMSDGTSHCQHEIHDDCDEVTIYVGSGSAGIAKAKADMKAGAAKIIKKVYEDGGQDGRASTMLSDHSEKGVYVNDDFVEAKKLEKILRKCGEDEE